MTKIEIPPLSVNKCWQGRRYKTKEYDVWRSSFAFLYSRQKKKNITSEKKVGVKVIFHIKNDKRSDLDNVFKPFFDSCVLCGIIKDDRFIYEIVARKEKTKKNEKEYIEFEFYNLKNK